MDGYQRRGTNGGIDHDGRVRAVGQRAHSAFDDARKNIFEIQFVKKYFVFRKKIEKKYFFRQKYFFFVEKILVSGTNLEPPRREYERNSRGFEYVARKR